MGLVTARCNRKCGK